MKTNGDSLLWTSKGVVCMNQRLLQAAGKGSLSEVRLAFEDGADIHARSTNNFTPLMHAASGGHYEVMKFLIQNGANVSDHDQYYNTLMCVSSGANSNTMVATECLKLLLKEGADPLDTDLTGNSSLVYAVRNNQEQIALNLIVAGCSVNSPNSDGWTPLFFAVQNGNLSMVQMLIDCGGKLNLMDNFGRTLTTIAATTANEDLNKLVASKFEPEYSIKDLGPPHKKHPFISSSYKNMLETAPKIDDRLHGFSDDAIQFLRGIDLPFVTSLMQTRNLQFNQLMTWTDKDWTDAGVVLSYHKNKIKYSVRKYHEKQWSKTSIPNISGILAESKVCLYDVLQVLATLLRILHINSSTTLYLKTHDTPRQELLEEMSELDKTLPLIKKQVTILKKICRNLEVEQNATPPDLIVWPLPQKKTSHFRFKLIFGCVLCGVLIKYSNPFRFFFKK